MISILIRINLISGFRDVLKIFDNDSAIADFQTLPPP